MRWRSDRARHVSCLDPMLYIYHRCLFACCKQCTCCQRGRSEPFWGRFPAFCDSHVSPARHCMGDESVGVPERSNGADSSLVLYLWRENSRVVEEFSKDHDLILKIVCVILGNEYFHPA